MTDINAVLRALKAPARREILGLIWDRDLPAGEIAAAFSLTSATISEHLAVLREAGLVEMTRVGTSRRYRALPDALAGLHGALEAETKWVSADDIPERSLAATQTMRIVVAAVDVATDQKATFTAFTDEVIYSRWLGVPVSIRNDRFSATLEWGTEVRGHYELVVPPELIVMSWDFEDDNVPVPGHPLTGYLRVRSRRGGAHVEVHQLVENPEQATFMEAAWGMVLGRLKAGVEEATTHAVPPRRKRPKKAATARSRRPA